MKKILSGTLAVLMLFSCFILSSCKKKKGGEEDESQPTVTTQDPGSDEGAVFTVPEDLNYGNRDFTILSYNCQAPEFGDTEGDMGDVVNYALVQRDKFTEGRLGVKIVVKSRNGQFYDMNDYAYHIVSSILGGEKAYDMIGSYSLVPTTLMVRGFLQDLNDTKYLDFSKNWWASFVYNTCTLNNRTYFMTGDISTNLLYFMQVVAFNSRLLNENNIREEDLYAMVDNGEWTLDRFFEVASNISAPDGEGNWTANAFYSVGMSNANMLDSFYIATGMHLFEIENDNLTVSANTTSDKVLNLYDKVYRSIYTDHIVNDPTNKPTFAEGKELFSIMTVIDLRTTLASTTFKDPVGVLPFPKYDEADSYRTLIGSPHTQYYIPIDAKDIDASSAVMETQAYASYQYVTPEVYYNVMKVRYSKDSNSSRMFDIIRSGSTTELGILSYALFQGGAEPASMFRNAILLQLTNWTSNFRGKFETGMKGVVGTLNDYYHS